jgi:[ribosomal protein S5]-alanine N-acetyltransferase
MLNMSVAVAGNMGKDSWSLTISTERLILRSQQPNDYEPWYAGFSGRLPKQHRYDDGLVSLADCDRQWFVDLCQRHQHDNSNVTDEIKYWC